MAPPIKPSAPQEINLEVAKDFSFEIFNQSQTLDPSVLGDLQEIARQGGYAYDRYDSGSDPLMGANAGASIYSFYQSTPIQNWALQVLSLHLKQPNSAGFEVSAQGLSDFLNLPINGKNDTLAKRIEGGKINTDEVLAQVVSWLNLLKNTPQFSSGGNFQPSDVIAFLKQQQSVPVQYAQAWLDELRKADLDQNGKLSLDEASAFIGEGGNPVEWMQSRQAFMLQTVAPMAQEISRSQHKWNFLPTVEIVRAYVAGLREEKVRQAHAYFTPTHGVKTALNLLGGISFEPFHDGFLAPFYDKGNSDSADPNDFGNALDEDGDLRTEYFDMRAQAAGEIRIGEYERALNSLEDVIQKSAVAYEQAVSKGEDVTQWKWLEEGDLEGALKIMEARAAAWEQGNRDIFGFGFLPEDAETLREDLKTLREVLPVQKLHDILTEPDAAKREEGLLNFALAEAPTAWGFAGGTNTRDRDLYNLSGRHFNLTFAVALFDELAVTATDPEIAKKAFEASEDMQGSGDGGVGNWLKHKLGLDNNYGDWSDVAKLGMTGRILGGLTAFIGVRGPGRELVRGVRNLNYSLSPTGVGYVIEGVASPVLRPMRRALGAVGRVAKAPITKTPLAKTRLGQWLSQTRPPVVRPDSALHGAALANSRPAGLFNNANNMVLRDFPFGIWRVAKEGGLAYLSKKFPKVGDMIKSIGDEMGYAELLAGYGKTLVPNAQGLRGVSMGAKLVGAQAVRGVQQFAGAAMFVSTSTFSSFFGPLLFSMLVNSAQASDHNYGEMSKSWGGLHPAYNFGLIEPRMMSIYGLKQEDDSGAALRPNTAEVVTGVLGIEDKRAHRAALAADPQFNQVGEQAPSDLGAIIEIPDMAEGEIR